jgi:uncharacterized protein
VSALLPILTTSAPADADPSVVISPRSRWEPGLRRLRARLSETPWLIAFSGGVDSAFVLHVASEVRDDVVALTAVSPTLPDIEREACIEFARQRKVRHLLVPSYEMEVDGFASNPVNRCYFCKTELYSIARREADALQRRHIADGVNLDDLGDHRPGLVAAEEHRVVHPLVEAGMTKADVRGAARALGLAEWNKPAFACLSSRFPYGTSITEERLHMVGTVELLLRELGFRQVRVRYHGDVCRIEVLPADLPRLVADDVRERVVAEARAAGFRYTTLDLQGYRMGSLNEGLAENQE